MSGSKFILGSGIVGMIARMLLGPEWELVPFGRSRFFSYKPSLDDNFIVRDERIDDFIEHLGGKMGYIHKTRYSLGGELFDFNAELCTTWASRIYGVDTPPRIVPYMKSRQANMVYDIRLNRLYEQFQNTFGGEIKEALKKGKLENIDTQEKTYVRDGKKHSYDAMISTIPLHKLYEILGIGHDLELKTVWYYHIKSPDLDFEGSNQLMIVDDFDFYKVTNIAKGRYLFYCMRETPTPGAYFMNFMRRFELLDGTVADKVLPCGDRPDTGFLEKCGIFPVGSIAEHDAVADVGSNIMRLLRIKGQLSE
jgi:hypothetical protein